MRNPFGIIKDGVVIIRDGFALCKFEDDNISRELYKSALKNGEDVAFNEEHKAMIQRYKDKTQKQILRLLKKELENVGGEVIKTKNEN